MWRRATPVRYSPQRGLNPSSSSPLYGDAGAAYKTVRSELEAYEHGLADKPEIVALSKADAISAAERKQQLARLKRAAKKTPLVVSAVSGEGVPDVLRALLNVIDKKRAAAAADPAPRSAWQP